MPLHQVSEAQLRQFLTDFCLTGVITLPVITEREARRQGSASVLNPIEQQVYDRVVADLATISARLNDIQGSVAVQDSIFDSKQTGYNGYRFVRTDFIGRHSINITRDQFYWTIGVEDNGGNPSKANIHSYYHMGTNGSLAQILDALSNTLHLFPSITPKTLANLPGMFNQYAASSASPAAGNAAEDSDIEANPRTAKKAGPAAAPR